MKSLFCTASHLLTAYTPRFSSSFYTRSRLISTTRVSLPEYEVNAKIFRQKMLTNPNDINAMYGLAKCINLGSSITASDIMNTYRSAMWVNKKTTSIDVEASLYRRILKSHSQHSPAIWELAQCLRKGAFAQFEDLRYTWLEGGYFLTKEGPGLTTPVTLLLAQALEERSKEIELKKLNKNKVINTKNKYKKP